MAKFLGAEMVVANFQPNQRLRYFGISDLSQPKLEYDSVTCLLYILLLQIEHHSHPTVVRLVTLKVSDATTL